MTEHVHDGLDGVSVVLLSSIAGLLQWMADPEVVKAGLVAALCGLIGGAAKPLGTYLARRARRWWLDRRGK